MAGEAEERTGEGTAHLGRTAVGERVLQAGEFSEGRVEGKFVLVEVAGGEGVGGVGGRVLQLGKRGWEGRVGDGGFQKVRGAGAGELERECRGVDLLELVEDSLYTLTFSGI